MLPPGLRPAGQAGPCWCRPGEFAGPVVADIDQEVLAVAIPLCTDPPDAGLVHHGKHQPADNRPGGVGHFAGQRTAVDGGSMNWTSIPLKFMSGFRSSRRRWNAVATCSSTSSRGAVAECAETHQGPDGEVGGGGARRVVVHDGDRTRRAGFRAWWSGWSTSSAVTRTRSAEAARDSMRYDGGASVTFSWMRSSGQIAMR